MRSGASRLIEGVSTRGNNSYTATLSFSQRISPGHENVEKINPRKLQESTVCRNPGAEAGASSWGLPGRQEGPLECTFPPATEHRRQPHRIWGRCVRKAAPPVRCPGLSSVFSAQTHTERESLSTIAISSKKSTTFAYMNLHLQSPLFIGSKLLGLMPCANPPQT